MISTKHLLNKLSLAATVFALFGLTQTANAGLILSLDDPGDASAATVVTDGGAGDINGAVGAITFLGPIGVWSINVSTGLGLPVLGTSVFPEIDLNSTNATSGAAGVLEIMLTQDGNHNPSSAFTNLVFNWGGTTDGTVTRRYCLGVTTFGCTLGSTPTVGYGPGAFSSSSSASFSTPGPYAMTIITTITHGAGDDNTSFNAELVSVPEPGMLTLLGIGLLGMGVVTRRRKVAA